MRALLLTAALLGATPAAAYNYDEYRARDCMMSRMLVDFVMAEIYLGAPYSHVNAVVDRWFAFIPENERIGLVQALWTMRSSEERDQLLKVWEDACIGGEVH